MEKSAVAYLANGTLILAPVVRTTSGLGLEIEPNSLGSSPDQGSIVDAIAQVLDRSARIVPHPAQSEWKGSFNPFQEAAGVRSYKAFMADARSVSLEVVDDKLKLTPQRNLGSKEGFEEIPDQAVLVPRDDLAGAAKVLLRMLEVRVG